MKKVKQIYCVNCPKFCQNGNKIEMRKFIEKLKGDGYSKLRFNCEEGNKLLKSFI